MVLDKGYEKAAHLYDIFDTKDNFDFFYQYGKESNVILDIGAGTGRIAISLAERGVRVVCIEPSPAMRREFLNKIRNRPEIAEKISLIAGDIQSFKLIESFPTAFLSSSFDHIPKNERITAFNNINRHLKYEGKVIFDIYLGDMKDSPLSPINNIKKGNYEYKRFISTKILPDNRIEVLLVYETYKQGKLIKKIEQWSSAFTTTQTEVHQLLDKTGFLIHKEYSDFNFSLFKKGDPLLIIEAIKRE